MRKKSAMKAKFTNTRTMVGFILKHDRISLSIYTVVIALFMIFLVPIFSDILNTSSNHEALVSTMRNPAMVAMVGPVYVDSTYTLGSIYANYMTVFTGLIFAAWNILFVTRHTRKEEEQGSLELVQSLTVGKVANLTATLVIAFAVNTLICLAMTIGFPLISNGEMDLLASFNFSLATTLFGFLFALVAAFFAQLATTSRMTNSLSFLLLMVTYLLRAAGDLSNEALSLISPLGLITRTKSFITNDWRPIAIIALEALVLILVAYRLAIGRDLQAGILREGKGRTTISPLVRGIKSFTFHLQKYQFLLWALVVFSFSGMYGSIFGDLEGFIESSDLIKGMLAVEGAGSLTDQFIAMLMVVMSMITTIPVLYFVNRILGEEKKGHAENILTKPVSRYTYFASFIGLAILAAVIYQVLVALGFWTVGRMTLETISPLSTFLVAALNYVPAILVMVGVATVLVAYLPNKAWLSYLYLGYAVLVIYLGRLLKFPEALEKFTPFGYVSNYPLEEVNVVNLVGLVVVGMALIFIGLKGYRERDLAN